jgi:molybdate transport system ATP-binding protein
MASLDLEFSRGLRDFAVGLSLAVGAEVVALAGPSGAGKTTVLRCVAGLDRPDGGSIRCDGEVWFDATAGTDLAPERRSVGYVPQHHALFPHLTVAQNVAFGGAAPAEVGALLDRFRIAGLAAERPGRLSGGERQRVALARALARRPRVLLLDEPLAALDAHTRRVVREELADELRELGLPTLLVTHDLTDATALADRVAVLVDGTVRQLGAPAELTAAPADAFVVELTGGFVLAGHGAGTAVALDHGGVVDVGRPVAGAQRVGLHPWDVEVAAGPGAATALRGVVRSLVAQGPRVRVRTEGWSGEADATAALAVGDAVHGAVRRAHLL